MKRFFGKIENGMGIVEGDELNHLKNVLRSNVGDEVILLNGDGYEYAGEILEINKNYAKITIKSQKKCPKNAKNEISLFISAIKREKLELVVQKAVELGVKNLYIFESDFSAMKLKGEKLVRYENIVISALKQCERADFMPIKLISFAEMLKLFDSCALKLFANERQGENFDFNKIAGQKSIGILVGCEGGFSQNEKKAILNIKNVENISLGKRILRAETAAILLCGMASLFSQN